MSTQEEREPEQQPPARPVVAMRGYRQSPGIGELAKALAKAQGVIEGAKKDADGQVGSVKKKYADLASVWTACREALSANGLSVTQIPTAGDGTAGVDTILAHGSGEWIAGTLLLPVAQRTPQAVGSAITYARRYALMAFVGIAPEDDDGEGAMPKRREEQRPQQQVPVASPAKPPAQPPINGHAQPAPVQPKPNTALHGGVHPLPTQEAASPAKQAAASQPAKQGPPTNGTELQLRLIDADRKWAECGHIGTGELIADLKKWAESKGFPPITAEWSQAQVTAAMGRIGEIWREIDQQANAREEALAAGL